MGNSAIKQKIERAEKSKSLSLDGCGLGPKDTAGVLKKLDGLRMLDLSRNKLKGKVPDEVGKFKELKKLILDMNRVTDISPVSELVNLEELCVNNNVLGVVTCLSSLQKLKKLSLSNSQVTRCSVEGLKNLREVNLSNNKLTEPPVGVFSLPLLLDLDLSHNQLTTLGDTVSAASLQTLNISHNTIAAIPNELLTATKLVNFTFDENPFTGTDLKEMEGYAEWMARQKKTVDKQISGGLTAQLIEEKK
eukprot:TRINITY_DN5010_c0_g1_i1.p3 TRINITY_DN5010_c0_g1~~TRINITY_DN5010_c0_g1_i1.p3  ORF type:complete len:265 (+),score=126.75 TRINITY_DN5010_c0_g1_i1:54-797(+)